MTFTETPNGLPYHSRYHRRTLRITAMLVAAACAVMTWNLASSIQHTDSAYTATSNSTANAVVNVVPVYVEVCSTSAYDYGITEDGMVYYGNGNAHFNLSNRPELTGIVMERLVCNNDFMAGLDSIGNIYVWPNNPVTITQISFPFTAGEKIVDFVSTRSSFSILTNTGRVFSYGANNFGQLGKGDLAASSNNSQVPYELQFPASLAGTKLKALGSGYNMVVGLTTNNRIIQWGRSDTGVATPLPWEVPPINAIKGKKFIDVGGGQDAGIALDDMGIVYSWGSSNTLGRNAQGSEVMQPDAVNSFGTIQSRPVSKIFTAWNGPAYAMLADGSLHTWGSGAMGISSSLIQGPSPIPVATNMSGALQGKTVTKLIPGTATTFAQVAEDNGAYWWGYGWFILMKNMGLPQVFSGTQKLIPG